MDKIVLTDGAGKELPLKIKRSKAVTPHDTQVLEPGILWVGVSGDLTVRLVGDDTNRVFKNVPEGWFLADVVLVHTDTTATDIVQCWP